MKTSDLLSGETWSSSLMSSEAPCLVSLGCALGNLAVGLTSEDLGGMAGALILRCPDFVGG